MASMKNFLFGFLVAIAVLTGGYFAYTRLCGNAAVKTAPKIMYHCPMHPTYISDKPGDCPICGMKLTKIEPSASPDQHAGHQSGAPVPSPGETPNAESSVSGYVPVTIPVDRIQSMGINVTEAVRMDLDQSFRTYGRVTFDETKVHHIHTRFEGYIEDLFVAYTGQLVTEGQPLFSIYSPELYATQNEYLLALRVREQAQQSGKNGVPDAASSIDLVKAARDRLTLWNISDKEIQELEKTRKPSRTLTVSTPFAGYVMAKTAVNGLEVKPADNLYDIVDLSTVWVLADIYEVNLPFIKIGQPATINLDYKPGTTWHGKLVFIDPTVDPVTRTIKARLEIANPDGELKPEMYAHVVIGGARATGVAIPDSAVIATGERNIVFIAKGEGVFEPREVILGARVQNLYQIKKGVSEGDKVVTGANFLLDSESKLKAAVSDGSGAHKHGSQP
jgi:membrane fusion protein, copper/silver efflux system